MSFLSSSIESQSSTRKVFNKIAFVLLVLGTITLPLVFFPFTQSIIDIPKIYFLSTLNLLLVFLFLFNTIATKEVKLRRTFLDIPVLFFLIISLLSSLFSLSPYVSLLGEMEHFTLNFFAICNFIVWSWFLVQFVNTPKKWNAITESILASSSIVGVIFLLRNTVLASRLLDYNITNTVSTNNTLFGLFMLVCGLLALGEILLKNRSLYRQFLPAITGIISIITLIRLDFFTLWVVFAIGIGLLIILGVLMLKQIRTTIVSVLFALFLVTLLILLLGLPDSMNANVSPEVSLDTVTSWVVSSQSVMSGIKSFLIGSGPSTFLYDFAKYKPKSFNLNSLVWNRGFSQPFNTLFGIFAELGVLGVLSFLTIFIITLGAFFRSLSKSQASFWGEVKEEIEEWLEDTSYNIKIKSLIVALSWLALSIGMSLFYFNASLWWLWWSLLVFSVIGLSACVPSFITEKKYSLEVSPQYSLALSFGGITLVVGLVLLGLFGTKIVLADVYYKRAVTSNSLEQKDKNLQKALSYRPNYIQYNLSQARLYLQKTKRIDQKNNKQRKELVKYLTKAVNITKKTAESSPNRVETWKTLADMYQNVTQLAPGARKWLKKSLNKSIELEPTNPELHWKLGNVYLAEDKQQKAIEQYKKAKELKPDYLIAYISLAKVYASQKKYDKAVSVYKPIHSEIKNSPLALFNLGVILYNRGKENDLDQARLVLEKAIEQKPKYVNALYTLALVHQKQGNEDKAEEYFKKVKSFTSKTQLQKKKQKIKNNTTRNITNNKS